MSPEENLRRIAKALEGIDNSLGWIGLMCLLIAIGSCSG